MGIARILTAEMRSYHRNLLNYVVPGIIALVLCGWAFLRYFDDADRKLAGIANLWLRGEKLEAVREYEHLLQRNPRVETLSLLEMYVSSYEAGPDKSAPRAVEEKGKALQLIAGLIEKEPRNALRGYLAAQTYDRLGNTNDAFQMYVKIAPLLEHDLAALKQDAPLADGTRIGPKGREPLIAAYEEDLRATRKRIVGVVGANTTQRTSDVTSLRFA